MLLDDLIRRGAERDVERIENLVSFMHLSHTVGVAEWQIDLHTPEQFATVCALLDDFNHAQFGEVSRRFTPMVPDLRQVTVHQFVGGPAIMFDIPFTDGQRLRHRHGGGAGAVQLSYVDRITATQKIIDAALDLHADAIRVWQAQGDQPQCVPTGIKRWRKRQETDTWPGIGSSPRRVRIWWD